MDDADGLVSEDYLNSFGDKTYYYLNAVLEIEQMNIVGVNVMRKNKFNTAYGK